MRYDYVVILKREHARRSDFVSFFLLLFSILAFLFAQIRAMQLNYFLAFASLLLLIGIWINIQAFRKGREMNFRNWLLAAGIFWVGMPFFQWMLMAFILFAILERQAKYPLEIGFSPDQIVVNSLFKKKFAWDTLETVILKDGVLTLNFRNNKIFQKEVQDDDDWDAGADEFNDYCREKLVNLHR